ncbi:MAG TPA: hypothetical protein VNY30_19525 [Bryobacteraceae bacterium]|nr:hypothetical protein [Bryobacteraceae bacterium]
MLIKGQKPTPSLGSIMASSPPSAPPIMRSGASTPPEVPDPSENAQMKDFTSRDNVVRHVALQERAYRVVANS